MVHFWNIRLAEEQAALDRLKELKRTAKGDDLEMINSQIAYHAGEKVVAKTALREISRW